MSPTGDLYDMLVDAKVLALLPIEGEMTARDLFNCSDLTLGQIQAALNRLYLDNLVHRSFDRPLRWRRNPFYPDP